VTAPLLLAAVLVVSAIGKLGAPQRARDALTAMGVPSWLDRPWVARAHPWAEISLAVLLIVSPGPLAVIAAGVAMLLMLAYLALVVRALRSPVDVDCACFGSLGGERVTAATVWRNAWLGVVASVALGCAVEGRSVAARLGSLDAAALWWLVAAAGTGLTVALVVGTGRPAPREAREPFPAGEEDYLRVPTPAVPVFLADGSQTDLRSLSSERAQLLLFVSETCGSCEPVIAATPTWQASMPQVDVRFVLAQGPESSTLTSTDHPASLHDPERAVRDSFAVSGTPGAVLLGADGFLAGGPITGSSAVPDFVDEIRRELESAADEAEAR
jgi:hypothetical protein